LPQPSERKGKIMDRKVFFALIAYTFVLVFLYLLYTILSPFLGALGWAAVIVIATYPVFRRVLRLFRVNQARAAGMMTILVFLVVVVPAVLLLGVLVREVTQVQETVSRWSRTDQYSSIDKALSHPWVAPIIKKAEKIAKIAQIDLKASAIEAAKRIISFIFGSLTGAVRQVAILFLQLILVVVSLFFLYKDGARLVKGFWSSLPIPEARKQNIHVTVENLVSAVVIGVLVTASIQGLLAGIGYWFVGLPSPAFLGILSGICALIPVVGNAIVWVPATAFLLLSGDTLHSLILLGWSILVVGMVDNFVRPLLISGRSGLSFTLMALGGLGGLATFGFFGLVAGPVIIAVFMISLDMYQVEVVSTRPEKEEPGASS
jgi:predicted PurR-regulated permease PerM